MGVVYIDEVFILNALVDYLLLVCSARVAGEPLRRWRFALAAALGGGYAAAGYLPGMGFLLHPLCKLCAGVALVLAAFGSSKRLLRVGGIFLGVSAVYAGGVLLLGGPALPSVRSVLASAAVCYALLSLFFRRAGRHAPRELVRCRLELEGRGCELTALVDTGSTLTDPVTGRPVMVAWGESVAPLLPPGQRLGAGELSHPTRTMARLEGRRWRLVPYRAVGVSWGLLLAVRVDRAVVGETEWDGLLVALSPTPISDGGGYHALIGA